MRGRRFTAPILLCQKESVQGAAIARNIITPTAHPASTLTCATGAGIVWPSVGPQFSALLKASTST